ncbi:IucA/IucC family C-terminal-domain containing protein [Bacillus sp. REN16]|uniref:IucA/IucC family C-terminal-domain containing protein n=1 Tax=Bacillus sp. REN16 TaxID=2887296 RepID=UPI001E4340B5|nr:IucA/IucC family C-terminal-domain containing protein [Bacillus sp. REN16]MCC3355802.1 (2Fe-2S)-binding protein [Bacillus sp. REN16]
MSNFLLESEIEQLKEFRFSDKRFKSNLSSPVIELFEDEKIKQYIKNIGQKISAPDKRVAASMFMKRYGFFAVLNLFAMTILNKRLNVSLSNISLETSDEEKIWYWNPKFYFSDLQTVPAPSDSREQWRAETVHAIFHDHIHEVLLTLTKHSGLSKKVLWENIAIYVYWLYESVLAKPKFDDKRKIIEEDFEFLIKKAEGELFGPIAFNPLTRYFGVKVYRPEYDQNIRTRKTCCLYYKTTSTGDRCKTCPLNCKMGDKKDESKNRKTS